MSGNGHSVSQYKKVRNSVWTRLDTLIYATASLNQVCPFNFLSHILFLKISHIYKMYFILSTTYYVLSTSPRTWQPVSFQLYFLFYIIINHYYYYHYFIISLSPLGTGHVNMVVELSLGYRKPTNNHILQEKEHFFSSYWLHNSGVRSQILLIF